MPRITPEEKARFKKILEDSIEKLETPKNSKKKHWSKEKLSILQKKLAVENLELDVAIAQKPVDAMSSDVEYINNVESECFDIINFALFIVDNLRGNK